MKEQTKKKVITVTIIVLLAALIGIKVWELIDKHVHEEELKKSVFFDNGNSVVMSADEIPTDCHRIFLCTEAENEYYRNLLSHEEESRRICCVIVSEDMMNDDTLRKVAASGAESVLYRCGYFGIEPLSEMKSLRRLNVQCELPGDFGEYLPQVTVLNVYSQISSLGSIAKMTSLHELYLSSAPALSDISGIKQLTELEKLDLSGTAVTDIRELAYLPKLRELNIMSTEITDISALWSLNELEVFDAYNGEVTDISALADKPKLRVVDLYQNPVSSIEALKSDTALERVELSYTKINDIRPLMNCPKLNDVSYYGCDGIWWDMDEEFREWFTSRGIEVRLHGVKVTEQ